MKQCKRCHDVKPLEAFHTKSAVCKDCLLVRKRATKLSNQKPDETNELLQRWGRA